MKALLIIDMQNDYFSGGKMELKDTDLALQNCLKLAKFAQQMKYKIYIIQHFSKTKNAPFFIPDSNGVELHKNLKLIYGEIIKKNFPNSFRETSLLEKLQTDNTKDILVCGAMTHMCIGSSVRAGFDLGFNITVASDACTTKDLTFEGHTIPAKYVQNAFLSALDGTFCSVKKTEDLVTFC